MCGSMISIASIYQTLSLLNCSRKKQSRKKVVVQFKCKFCTQFVERIQGSKNFSDKWIIRADSVRLSNNHDHALNDQHTHGISILKKQHTVSACLGPSCYAPITQVFNKLSDEEREKLWLKHEIACFVVTENLPLYKLPKDLWTGSSCTMKFISVLHTSTKMWEKIWFTTYDLMKRLGNAKFFHTSI